MKTKYLWTIIILLCVIIIITHFQTHRRRTFDSNITVSGTGTIYAQPDNAQLTISLYHVARTTKLAQDEVSKKARRVMDILKKNNIEDKNISTASLSFRSEYDYRNVGRVFLGQRAEQRLTISVEGIKEDADLLSRIIDEVSEINGIDLENIYFNVKNNTEFFARSRELAFQKAMDKAKQYANLAGLEIVKVTNIAEEGNQYYSPFAYAGTMNRAMATNEALLSKSDAGMSVLPSGEFEITSRVMIEVKVK